MNEKYQFIDLTLSEDELETINKMSKLSRMPLDLTLCANANQLKIFSSSHLNHCLKTFNSDVFFCSERRLKNLRHDSKRCSQLPHSVTFEITPHKILMRSKLNEINITLLWIVFLIITLLFFFTISVYSPPIYCFCYSTYLWVWDWLTNIKILKLQQ